jgi:outer membrane protein OmpA-like peptidoglycan-associated protein
VFLGLDLPTFKIWQISLLQKGVNTLRIKAEGYGKTRPDVPNSSDENRKLNRWIEVKFL